MPAMRQVALLIETSRGFGRGLLRGVAQYCRENSNWATHFRPHGLGDACLDWISDWRGDGILVRTENERIADAVRRPGVPVVELLGKLKHQQQVPMVRVNDRSIAKIAAQHLLDRGFHNFGCCGYRIGNYPFLDIRVGAFRQYIEEAGYPCSMLHVYDLYVGKSRLSWERQQARIAEWVKQLPKPVGIMAVTDDRAFDILGACRMIGALVPDEVAVIGVDNDECIGQLTIPPLTSIDPDPPRIGYRAAALLDSLMDGDPPPSEIIYIEPRGLVKRQSTDVLAVDDVAVSEAIRYIRENACHAIHVSDVLAHVRSSRVTLETGMKRAIGRTIHQEIHRVRIETARQLLAATNLPVKKIAVDSGFRTVQYLTRVFTEAVGIAPASYRRQSRIEP